MLTKDQWEEIWLKYDAWLYGQKSKLCETCNQETNHIEWIKCTKKIQELVTKELKKDH